MTQWNLARLAETLLPLIAEDRERAIALASGVIETFEDSYQSRWLEGMRRKLGLNEPEDKDQDDHALAGEWLTLLEKNKVDFTLAWRKLADAAEGNLSPLRDLFYDRPALDAWLGRWQARCGFEDKIASSAETTAAASIRARGMRKANPWLIPRNHRVEEALAAASDEGNLEPFKKLLGALTQPYDEHPDSIEFAQPAPEDFTADYRTFCGT